MAESVEVTPPVEAEVDVPDRPLTLTEAHERPLGELFQVVAWLWRHVPDCPECPPGDMCEPCRLQHVTVGDRPQRCESQPCHAVHVDYHDHFEGLEVGRPFLIIGHWSTPDDQGRLLTAATMAPIAAQVSPTAGPVPASALVDLAAPWRCETTADCQARLRLCRDGRGQAHCRETASLRGGEHGRVCAISCDGVPTIP